MISGHDWLRKPSRPGSVTSPAIPTVPTANAALQVYYQK